VAEMVKKPAKAGYRLLPEPALAGLRDTFHRIHPMTGKAITIFLNTWLGFLGGYFGFELRKCLPGLRFPFK
jgi:hypothetical protein